MRLIIINDNAIVPLLMIGVAILLILAFLVYGLLLTAIHIIRKGREQKKLTLWQGILLYMLSVLLIFGLAAILFTLG